MMAKSENLVKFLKTLVPTGMSAAEAAKVQKCVWCGGEAKEFKDEISKREYAISGLCQACQDRTFTEEG